MKTSLTLAILVVLLFSCNSRVAREKALKDLELFQKKEASFKAQIEGAENRLRIVKEDYVVATDRLNRVGEFQLLRTTEREKQIRAATDQVLAAQQNIKDSEFSIKSLSDSLNSAQASVAKVKEALKD